MEFHHGQYPRSQVQHPGPVFPIQRLIDGYLAERQGDSVKVRDLATLNLPVLDGELAMGLRGGENLNERQLAVLAQSDELVAELKASDLVIIAAPCTTSTSRPS